MKRIISYALLLFILLGNSTFLYAQEKQAAGQKSFLSDYRPPQPPVREASAATFLGTLFKFAFSLVVVIILIYLTVYVLKIFTSKYTPTGGPEGRLFEIIDSLSLGQGKTIYLINVDNIRILAVSVSDKEVTLLDKIENGDQVNGIVTRMKEKINNAHAFKEHLKVAQRKKAVEGQIKAHLNNLTEFFRSLKKR